MAWLLIMRFIKLEVGASQILLELIVKTAIIAECQIRYIYLCHINPPVFPWLQSKNPEPFVAKRPGFRTHNLTHLFIDAILYFRGFLNIFDKVFLSDTLSLNEKRNSTMNFSSHHSKNSSADVFQRSVRKNFIKNI